MPYASDAQRRYIFLQASLGKAWAIKFIRDAGDTPPRLKAKRTKRRKAKHS